jgi:hypothetical protein
MGTAIHEEAVMHNILKLKTYVACAALVATTAGLTGCYVAPYGPPRPYAYAAPVYPAPAYGYYGGGYYRHW